MRGTLEQRFWGRVTKWQKDECWLWTGSVNKHGYGKINLGPRGAGIERAHRVSWLLTYGPIPEGLCVLHKCDNPPCVNPAHLFLGTRQDNQRDMMQKGRMSPPPIHCGDAHPLRRNPAFRSLGEHNGNSKYTSAQAKLVWGMVGSYAQIAKQTGLNRNFIAGIKSGKTWLHVTKGEQTTCVQ